MTTEAIRRIIHVFSTEGENSVVQAHNKVASATETTGKATLSLDRTFAGLERRYVSTIRAQQDYERVQRQVNAAVAQNPALQQRANVVLEEAKRKYDALRVANDNFSKSQGLARYELINLSRQIQDVGVSLAGGQKPLTVLVQQGAQIGDIFSSTTGTFRGFVSQVLGFVARNPFLILAGGAAAVGVAVAAAASYLNNYVKVLDDLSQSTGIAAKELSQLRESAAIKGIGNDDFASSMNNFADKIDEAKKGTNELGQLFRLNNKAISDNVTNLYTVADLVKNAADYQDKKNILEAAGLPTTADAVRYYSQGAEELRKQKEAAAGFGEETKKLADNARAFDTAWNTVWESFKTYAVNSIAEVINALKQLTSDPTVQAIMSFLSMTPGEAYAAWKGAVTRTIDRARGYSAGAEAFGLSYPSASSIKPEQQQYGPDIPKITETVKALKEQIRVLQEHNSLLGDSATASDKLALAELKIKQAIASGIPLTEQEMKAIRENAVAVKEKAAAHDKIDEALRRSAEARQGEIDKLQLEIKNIFMSAEAARAEKIALEEVIRLRKAGVPEDRIPFGDINDAAKIIAAAEKQVETLKKVKQAIQEVKDAGIDFASQLVSGILDGKKAMDSLADAAINVGQQLKQTGIKTAKSGLAAGNLAVAAAGGIEALIGWGIEGFGGKQKKAAEAAAKAAQELAAAQQKWRDMASDFSAWIHDWTTGVSGELHSAISSARSQMQQFANAAAAAHDPGGVASAQAAFNTGVTRSINEALDALLNLGVETSSYSQKLKEAKDKAEDIRLTLIEFGTSAEEAALAVETRLNVAVARLRDQFLDDLVRKVNELAGGAWINQLTDLVDEVAQLRADAAALGIQTTLIDEYYVRAAQNIINENELVGSAFDAVAATLGPLGAGLHEFSAAAEEAAQALKRSAQEIANTIQSYQDQLFIAQQDTQTLAGQLAVFDLQAQRAREQEIAAGGEALAALEALQAQQRLNIINDYNRRIAEEQQRALEQQLEAQRRAAEEAQRVWDEAAKFLQNATQNIQNWISSFLGGSQSPLSPLARLSSAQSTFSNQYSAALGGNRDALQGITGNTQTLIDAIKSVYGSTSAGQTLINQAISQLQSLPAQLSPEQFIVENLTPAINDVTAGVDAQTSAMQTLFADLQAAVNSGNASAIAAALLPVFNSIDTNTDNALTFAEMQSALGATYSTGTLRSIFTELDGNGNGILEKSELIKTATQTTGTNTGSTSTNTANMPQMANNISTINGYSLTTSTNTGNIVTAMGGFSGSNYLATSVTNLSAIISALGSSGVIPQKLGDAGIGNSLIGEAERIRSNLYEQNLNWGDGWAPSGATYIAAGAQIQPYATGGYVYGPSHANGGRIIEVEGGEYIVNKRDTARFRSQLDGMNYRHQSPANDNGDMRELIARIDRLERRLVAATIGGAQMVSDRVGEVADEQSELNKRLGRSQARRSV